MAQRRKPKNKNTFNWAVVWSLVAIALFCLIITFGDMLGFHGIPTWQELGAVFNPQQQASDGSMPVSVNFFDVGQGDCTLISANGRHILIDAGENDQADRVVSYLRQNNIEKLDIVIATHPHSDHIGGLDAVINTFPVDQVIMPKLSEEQTPTTKTYLDLLTAIADKNVKVKRAEPGETIEIGGGQLEIRGPLGIYTDINNASVVTRYVYDEVSFWIAGDCSKEAEKDLLAQNKVEKTTVYKVSHHGSSSATSQAFLDALSPEYCVLSLGADNSYGHPHKEVSQRLKKLNVPLYRTDLNGTVTITTDGKAVAVATEK